jgi:UDP-N-acetylmuramate dehydrogenase
MVRLDARLSEYTRFALGGPVDRWIDCAEADDFVDALRAVEGSHLVLGGGTNLLASDDGYRGTILRYTGAKIEIAGTLLRAESGADLEAAVNAANGAGLAGLESMMRIPGWISGAVYGNAGAYGQSIHEIVERVEIFDGRARRWIPGAACGFAYRTSGFKQRKDWIILAAEFRLRPGDRDALAARSEEIRAIRDEKFPVTMRCAGSIFKNCLFADLPESARSRVPSALVKGGKVPSAFFLEQVGAKGMVRGGIRVASYHANLLHNSGSGTAREAVELIDELMARVEREFGLRLEEEVQYIGFAGRESH